jgi:hypothetical protein
MMRWHYYDNELRNQIEKPWPVGRDEQGMRVRVREGDDRKKQPTTFRVVADFPVDYETGRGKGRAVVTRNIRFEGTFTVEGSGPKMNVHVTDITARASAGGSAAGSARDVALEIIVPAFRAWYAYHASRLRCFRASQLFATRENEAGEAARHAVAVREHERNASSARAELRELVASDPAAQRYVRKLETESKRRAAKEAAEARKRAAAAKRAAKPRRPKT